MEVQRIGDLQIDRILRSGKELLLFGFFHHYSPQLTRTDAAGWEHLHLIKIVLSRPNRLILRDVLGRRKFDAALIAKYYKTLLIHSPFRMAK